MKNILEYIYYRLISFHKKYFEIEDSPGFLIQSCYEWGSQILMATLSFYSLSLITFVLWCHGIKMKALYIVISILPFFLLHVFSEMIFGEEKEQFKRLEKNYKNDKHKLLKGILIGLFVGLSLPCYLTTLFLCLK